MTAELSKEEILRYSRHLIVPEVTLEGQKKLKSGSVLLIGTGGLGAPVSMYLAAAGIGRLGLVDFDKVDFTNLQRQVLFTTPDVGRSKLDAAKDRLAALNPYVQIDTYEERFSSENALRIIRDYDIVIDGTDNFPTRYCVNDACVLLGKTNIYGSIFRFEGQASVFKPREGPCYRCLYPEPPPPGMVPSCAEGGVLGILPGTVGTLQATEGIKLLLGIGAPLVGRMLLYDALDMTFTTIKVRKDPNCPVCSLPPEQVELIDYEQFCGMPAHDHSEFGQCSADAVPIESISARQLKARLDAGERPALLDVRNPPEWDISRLDGAHPGVCYIPKPQIEDAVSAVLAGRARAEDTVLANIPASGDVVLCCRSGVRSADAIHALRRAGYSNRLLNLEGGILAWAEEIDPAMATY